MIMIKLGSIIIFTIILVINSALVTFGKIDKLTFIEFLVITSALFGIYQMHPNEYYMFYAISIILFVSYTFIRKTSVYVQNNMFGNIIMIFIFSKLGISIYRFFVSKSFAEKYGDVIFSIFIISIGIIILILGYIKRKNYIKTDKYINQRMLYFNVILFIIILLSHYFYIFIVKEVSDPRILYLLLDLCLNIGLIFVIVLNGVLKKYHEKNIKLLTVLDVSDKELRKSYRKNHNVSNLVITINHLLKERKYEECKNYINDFKGEINET